MAAACTDGATPCYSAVPLTASAFGPVQRTSTKPCFALNAGANFARLFGDAAGCPTENLLLLEETEDLVLKPVSEADRCRGRLLGDVLVASAAPARVVVRVLHTRSDSGRGDDFFVEAGRALSSSITNVCSACAICVSKLSREPPKKGMCSPTLVSRMSKKRDPKLGR